MIALSIIEFLFGVTVILFAKQIYEISWYSNKDLKETEIKIYIASIRVLGLILIILGSLTLINT
jgi:hypothetical protein